MNHEEHEELMQRMAARQRKMAERWATMLIVKDEKVHGEQPEK